MGNVCCQTDIENSPLESDIPKVNQYLESTLPSDDRYLQEWIHENNFKIQPDEHHQVKAMKHRELDRYYYGKWENGVPEGTGLLYEPDKLLFNGQFHKGLPEGRANVKFIDQMCQYQGQLKAGRAHGTGTIDNLKQKYRFAGEWDESRPKKGTLTFTSDPNISNIQIQDFKNGDAIIVYKDGRRYQGKINTNRLLPNGDGKVIFPSNSNKLSYEGNWHNGIMHGKGRFLYSDGSSYDGEYINGRKEGNGTFIFPNGNYYEGYFLGGKQDGAGILFNRNRQELKKGSWKNGQFQIPLNKEEWAKESKLTQQKLSKLKQVTQEEFKRQDEQQKHRSAISKKQGQISRYKNQLHHSQQKHYGAYELDREMSNKKDSLVQEAQNIKKQSSVKLSTKKEEQSFKKQSNIQASTKKEEQLKQIHEDNLGLSAFDRV